VSWIRDDWRLKLLAVGLAVLMLGAVAFSQNPPTSKTMQLGIAYTVPSGLIVLNPPTRTTVTITGLADLVSATNGGNTLVTADLTKVSAGTGVKVNLVGKSVIPGVTVQTTPVVLNIDQRAAVKLTVNVRTPRGTAPGWQITKIPEAQCPNYPCSVTFDGPVSWEANLKAYADFPLQVTGSVDYPNQPVVLERNDLPLDLKKPANATVPQANLVDIDAVTIHIEAKAGTTSRQVVLVDSAPSNPPPACYRITGIVIDPAVVVITGPPDALTNITTITLPAVNLSQSTSSAVFKVTIPYPDAVNGLVGTARVAYSISQNPNCASPSP
jgi:YbbR domain-containing protein